MNRRAVLCFMLSVALASCTSPNPPSVQTSAADAQFTIYCQGFSNSDHMAQSQLVRQALLNGSALKDWYLVHKSDQSILYFGYYATLDQAKKDRARIAGLVDSNGDHPFPNPIPVPIDSPDPEANPAWDLTNSSGFYSLEIGVYKDSPERKQAAVDAVRGFRGAGVEAYYFHDQNASAVCIGSWPKEAARENQPESQNDNPNTPLFVTTTPLPDQIAQKLDQRGWKPVAPQFEPVDPTMIEAQQKFPSFAVNGEVPTLRQTDAATGQTKFVPAPSFFVRVPHDDSKAAKNTPATPEPTVAPQQPTVQPGMGQLKSIPE
jgi:hypothetical protein